MVRSENDTPCAQPLGEDEELDLSWMDSLDGLLSDGKTGEAEAACLGATTPADSAGKTMLPDDSRKDGTSDSGGTLNFSLSQQSCSSNFGDVPLAATTDDASSSPPCNHSDSPSASSPSQASEGTLISDLNEMEFDYNKKPAASTGNSASGLNSTTTGQKSMSTDFWEQSRSGTNFVDVSLAETLIGTASLPWNDNHDALLAAPHASKLAALCAPCPVPPSTSAVVVADADAPVCSEEDFAQGTAFVRFPSNCIVIKSSKRYEDVNLLTRLYRRHTNGRCVTGNMKKSKVEEAILEEHRDIVQKDSFGLLVVVGTECNRTTMSPPIWITSSTDPRDRLSDVAITVNGIRYCQASDKAIKKSISERNTKQTFHRPINQKTIEHAKDQANWLLSQKPELRQQLSEFMNGVMEIVASMAGKVHFRDTWEEQYILTINKIWNKFPKPDMVRKSSSTKRKNKKSQQTTTSRSSKKQRKKADSAPTAPQVGDTSQHHEDSPAESAAAA